MINNWSKRMNWCKHNHLAPANNYFWELSQIGIEYDVDLHTAIILYSHLIQKDIR